MTPETPKYKFRVYPDAAGKWRWKLIVAANGRRIASSGESFDSKDNAIRAARLVQRVAGTAPIKIASPPLRRAA